MRTLAAFYALYWPAWLALGVVVGCVILWRRVIQTATAPPDCRIGADSTIDEYDMATGYYPGAVNRQLTIDTPGSEGLGEPPVLQRAHSPCIPLWSFDESARRVLREILAEHPEGAA